MTKINSKILILVPAATARGGITNYYLSIRDEFSDNIKYFERGARTWPIRKGFIREIFRAWKDYQSFKKRLARNDVSLVQTTTSLGLSTTIRDGLFIRYAQKRGLKSIVFFRGWDDRDEDKINNKYLFLFKYLFFNADCLIVLSEKEKRKLLDWGYDNKIYIETTVVDKLLLKGINESFLLNKYEKLKSSKTVNLLFLSRVEKRKGIYELIDAFKNLKQNENNTCNYHLNIYGDGFELDNVRNKIAQEKIKAIETHGFVSGEKKINAFKEAHIFIFPSYSEGMPNAVLEAMGFGLPVITTPVGGLVDLFVHGAHGKIINVKDSHDIIKSIQSLILDYDDMLKIGLNNYKLANELFMSDKVAKRIEAIFNNVLNTKS